MCVHYMYSGADIGCAIRSSVPGGLCISSGVVEAGCKQIGARLKHAGMRWTVAGANAIIAPRCCVLSGCFEDFWGAASRQRLKRPLTNLSCTHPHASPVLN